MSVTSPSASETSPRDAVMRVYFGLREALVNGEVPAERLLLETDIGTQFGVSRTPVREALARLEQDGFLVRMTRGYQQRTVEPSMVVNMWETRIVLEQSAAVAAAARRSQLELARLAYLHEELTRSTEPGAQASLRNQFHQSIWAATHNPSLVGFIEQIFLHLRVFDRKRHSEQDEVEKCAIEHARILEAVAAGDGDAAGRAMAEHLERLQLSRIGLLAQAPY